MRIITDIGVLEAMRSGRLHDADTWAQLEHEAFKLYADDPQVLGPYVVKFALGGTSERAEYHRTAHSLFRERLGLPNISDMPLGSAPTPQLTIGRVTLYGQAEVGSDYSIRAAHYAGRDWGSEAQVPNRLRQLA